MSRKRSPHSAERGVALVAMCVSMFLLLAMIGLVFDLGRIYIARNEAQIFTDAASMAAAKALDGTDAGLAKARAAVAGLPNRWNLGSTEFASVEVEFSEDGSHWDAKPKSAADIRYARVSAPANRIEITWLRAVGGPREFTIPAHAASQMASGTNRVRLVE
jgi:uncharacterized membrane protein